MGETWSFEVKRDFRSFSGLVQCTCTMYNAHVDCTCIIHILHVQHFMYMVHVQCIIALYIHNV